MMAEPADTVRKLAWLFTLGSIPARLALPVDKSSPKFEGRIETDTSTHGSSDVDFVPKPYVCNKCSKAFGGHSHLRRHLRVHTGETPFECCECGKKFSQKSNMERHIAVVHLKQRPYKCLHCNHDFGQKVNYQIHMNSIHDIRQTVS